MRPTRIAMLFFAAAFAGTAQQWELCGGAGYGVSRDVPVAGPAGSATAGLAPGPALTAFLDQNEYRHLGGQLRYTYSWNDLRIRSGSATATFTGMAHTVHYDVILHTAGERTQFFVALGGGFRIFRGTGTEAAYQPLMQYAYLTKTQKLEPMGDAGAGIKLGLTRRVFLRIEARDYITPFPTEVITPAKGASFGGSILHSIVPVMGISFGL